MNSFECTMYVTILATEIKNNKTPVHHVGTLLTKPSEQIYQLPKVIGIYHICYLMGRGTKGGEVLPQSLQTKAHGSQVQLWLCPGGSKLLNGLCNTHDKQLCPGP